MNCKICLLTANLTVNVYYWLVVLEIVLQAPRGGLVDQHTKSDWHTKSDMTALLRTRRLT